MYFHGAKNVKPSRMASPTEGLFPGGVYLWKRKMFATVIPQPSSILNALFVLEYKSKKFVILHS